MTGAFRRAPRRAQTLILPAAVLAMAVACGGAAPTPTAPPGRRLIAEPPGELLGPEAAAPLEVLDGLTGLDGWVPLGPAARWRRQGPELLIEPGAEVFDLERPAALAASLLDSLEVVLASGYKVDLSLAWRREGEGGEGGGEVELGYDAGRGEPHRRSFVFDLAAQAAWSGTVNRLRLRLTPARRDERIVLRGLHGWRRATSADSMAEISRRPWRVELDHEVRDALVVPPGHPLERDVAVPQGGVLTFGLGATGRLSAPLSLRLTAARSGSRPALLHASRLAPLAGAAERRWQEVRVDLGAFAGETLRLRFESVAEGSFDPALGFPACGNPEIVSASVPATAPNVILVSVDTLRADRLPPAGRAATVAPHLDAWVRRGAVVFANAVAPSPWTLPSHASLLSGLDALRHGVNQPFRAAPSGLSTLAERLYAAGYATAGITGGGWLHPSYGLSQGFERYRYWVGEGCGDRELEAHAEIAARWLAELREPFFLFLHTYDVHDFDAADRSPPAVADDPGADPGRRYDRAVTHMDGRLGGLLAAFEASGRRGRTLFALTSDHGEDLGEAGVFGHGSLREEVLLVPLLLELPDGGGGGRVIREQVRSVDVAPTLLDLAGVASPGGLDGVSLRSLLEGSAGPPQPLASSYFALRHGLSLRLGNRWKYLYDPSAWLGDAEPDALYRLSGGEPPRRHDPQHGDSRRERFRALAVRLLERHLAGLRLRFENTGPSTFVGTLRGDLVRVGVPKSTDLSGSWLTRSGEDEATFSLPAGRRFHLLFESVGAPRFELSAGGRRGGAEGAGRVVVDLATSALPVLLRWTGEVWQEVADGAVGVGGVGVAVEWHRSPAEGGAAAPFETDPELRRQLEALGYLD